MKVPGQVQAQPGAHGWADPSDASTVPTICQPTLPCLSCSEITESRVVGEEKPEELNKCPQKNTTCSNRSVCQFPLDVAKDPTKCLDFHKTLLS
jgi:hypothetical protein